MSIGKSTRDAKRWKWKMEIGIENQMISSIKRLISVLTEMDEMEVCNVIGLYI